MISHSPSQKDSLKTFSQCLDWNIVDCILNSMLCLFKKGTYWKCIMQWQTQYTMQQECSRQLRDVIMCIQFQILNGSNWQMFSYYHANNTSGRFTNSICRVILEMDKHWSTRGRRWTMCVEQGHHRRASSLSSPLLFHFLSCPLS